MKKRMIGLLAVLLLSLTQVTFAQSGAYLGITASPAESGVEVASVRPDTAAAKAGIAEGDILHSINDQGVTTTDELIAAISKFAPGDTVEISLTRGTETLRLTTQLGSRPPAQATAGVPAAEAPRRLPPVPPTPPPAAPTQPRVRADEPTPPMPQQGGTLGIILDREYTDGARIASVLEGGPADVGRIRDGDILRRIDGRNVDGIDGLLAVLATTHPGQRVEVVVDRDGKERTRRVALASRADLERLVAAQQAGEGESVSSEEEELGEEEEEVDSPRAPVAPPGFLGVMIDGSSSNGALIGEALHDGPAARGGLQGGDLITSINGKSVSNASELATRMASLAGGTTIQVGVSRDGESLNRRVTLGGAEERERLLDVAEAANEEVEFEELMEEPELEIIEEVEEVEEEPADEQAWLGIEYEEVKDGVRIVNTLPASPASNAGLRNNDLITAIGDHRVESAEDLIDALSSFRPGSRVRIGFERDAKDKRLTVRLGNRADAQMLAESSHAPTPDVRFPAGRQIIVQGGHDGDDDRHEIIRYALPGGRVWSSDDDVHEHGGDADDDDDDDDDDVYVLGSNDQYKVLKTDDGIVVIVFSGADDDHDDARNHHPGNQSSGASDGDPHHHKSCCCCCCCCCCKNNHSSHTSTTKTVRTIEIERSPKVEVKKRVLQLGAPKARKVEKRVVKPGKTD